MLAPISAQLSPRDKAPPPTGCAHRIKLMLRWIGLLASALYLSPNAHADACDLDLSTNTDVVATALDVANAAGIDIIDIMENRYEKTIFVYVDEFIKTSRKTGKTKFHIKDGVTGAELPRIHIFVYTLAMRSLPQYASELKSRVNPDCPENNGMDSPFGIGLMTVTVFHEFLHVCLGENIAGGDDPWSCLHLAIDFGVHQAFCDYVRECLPMVPEDEEKREKLKGICKRLESIENKINSTKGQQEIAECTEGCDPSSSDPGYKPGNNICGSTFIPCPDGSNTTLGCTECSQL